MYLQIIRCIFARIRSVCTSIYIYVFVYVYVTDLLNLLDLSLLSNNYLPI